MSPSPVDSRRVSRRGLLAWAAVVVALGTAFFFYRHLAILAEGGTRSPLPTAIDEYVAALGGGLLFFAVRRFVRTVPFGWEALPVYLAAAVAFSVAATSWRWAARSVLYPFFGLGAYDYGRMPLRYLMEFPIDLIGFTFIALGVVGWDRLEAARRRELRDARLEARLARAQVHNLRLQLQPHFLFNALNTISATLHDDPDAADEMIDRLAALLRASLGEREADTVSLASELELLDAYLGILRARFGDRLDVEVDVDPGLDDARVPSLLLQPLVENAIRHGSLERQGGLESDGASAGHADGHSRVRVVARRLGDRRLEIRVDDDGPGVTEGRDPLSSGLGLSTTAERLQLLYGDRHDFAAGNRPEGGFGVRVVLPIETEAP